MRIYVCSAHKLIGLQPYSVYTRGYQPGKWSQIGTMVKGQHHSNNPLLKQFSDLNRYKDLGRSNHPKTSGAYPREDDVLGYEQQFLLSGGLPVSPNLSYKLER